MAFFVVPRHVHMVHGLIIRAGQALIDQAHLGT